MKSLWLLIIGFLLQLFGCYSLRKTMAKIENNGELKKELKTSFTLFLPVLIILLILVLGALFVAIYIEPSLEKELLRMKSN